MKNNHSEVVKILVNANANVNAEDERGITPLLLAGSTVTQEDPNEISKFVNIIEILVSANASTNVAHPDTGRYQFYIIARFDTCLTGIQLIRKFE